MAEQPADITTAPRPASGGTAGTRPRSGTDAGRTAAVTAVTAATAVGGGSDSDGGSRPRGDAGTGTGAGTATGAGPGVRGGTETGSGSAADAGPGSGAGTGAGPGSGAGAPAASGASSCSGNGSCVGAGARTRTGTAAGPGLAEALLAEAAAVDPGGAAQGAAMLAERSDSTVVRSGGTVVKAHAADTDRGALAARLAVAADPLLAGILLAPLPGLPPTAAVRGRPVSAWPYGVPVDRDSEPEAAPWEEAAVLLARLHRVPLTALAAGPWLPPAMRGPAKAARAVARMLAECADPDPAPLAAWSLLPAWARAEAPQPPRRRALCHGDLHLGQLVRHPPPDGPWLLIDVDDLGPGEPAWDLARPAMWFAAGVLAPEVWARFLGAYRAAGGPAVPPDGDPWPYLDVPARALAVQTAALAVTRASAEGRVLDETEQAVLDACRRMAEVS